jgi:hypothetical protein
MIEILGHIYYASGIFTLMKMGYSASDRKELLDIEDWRFRFSQSIGRKPKDKEFRTKEEFNTLSAHSALNAFEFIWCSAGLMLSGSQDIFAAAFLAILASSIACRILAYGSMARFLRTVSIFARLVIYTYAIITHFYR